MIGGNTATFRYVLVGIMLVTVDPHERWEYCDIPMLVTVDPHERWEYCDIPICGGRYHASYSRPTRAVGILRHSDMWW